MEIHRLLTVLGFVLLIATITIFYINEEKSQEEFSFAYVTGIAMIIVFLMSLGIFNKDKFKEKNSKNN